MRDSDGGQAWLIRRLDRKRIPIYFGDGVNREFSGGFARKLGYRYLSRDYADGGAKSDVAVHAPDLGIGIAF